MYRGGLQTWTHCAQSSARKCSRACCALSAGPLLAPQIRALSIPACRGEMPYEVDPETKRAMDAAEHASIEPELANLIIKTFDGEKDDRGCFDGHGVAAFDGGHTYAGSFAHGMMDGEGKYTWADGTTYEGEFRKNRIEGRGVYTWVDGSTYDGEVSAGLRHGALTPGRCARSMGKATACTPTCRPPLSGRPAGPRGIRAGSGLHHSTSPSTSTCTYAARKRGL